MNKELKVFSNLDRKLNSISPFEGGLRGM